MTLYLQDVGMTSARRLLLHMQQLSPAACWSAERVWHHWIVWRGVAPTKITTTRRMAIWNQFRTLVHIFIKYWPIYRQTLWEIVNKVIVKDTATAQACRHTTVCNITVTVYVWMFSMKWTTWMRRWRVAHQDSSLKGFSSSMFIRSTACYIEQFANLLCAEPNSTF